MNYRRSHQRRPFNYRRNIQWRSTYCDMEEKEDNNSMSTNETLNQHDNLNSDSNNETGESENSNDQQSQCRIFDNGQERFANASSCSGLSRRVEYLSLSSQKYQGRRNTRRFPRDSYHLRGYRGSNRRARPDFKQKFKDKNRRTNFSSHSNTFTTESEDEDDDKSSNAHKMPPMRSSDFEFLPNCVNVNKRIDDGRISADEKHFNENASGTDIGIGDPNDKLQEWRIAKEKFFSMTKSISSSEIIMDYRQQIEKMSNDCTKKNLAKIEKISSMIISAEAYAPILKLHYNNLLLQQKNFDAYISSVKHACSVIHDKSVDDIIKKGDTLKMHIEKECNLFKKTLPAYAYKSDILNALKEYQVIIVPSDSSYFFNVVCPIIIRSELPNYFILSCETSSVSCDWVKNDIENIIQYNFENCSDINCVTEDKLLKHLKSNSTAKNCFVVSLPLKRTVISDLLLAHLREILSQQNDCKLILLLSVFDNTKNYQKYFSDQKVFLLEVPKLLLPIETVWKKEPLSFSQNYKEDIVCTILSIHILNEPGDILTFLPSLVEAKTALVMFIKKVQELNDCSIEGFLIHENSTNVLQFKNPSKTEKRRVFFVTNCAEALPFPSVKYVIDCGITRDYIYDRDKNLDILTTVFNSRAKARLRKSIVGVYASGICYRIYNKENFCTDMPSFESPDILTLNPFNTLITIFHHEPERALSVQFVEPLSDTVKCNTVKLLKNFNAIKNGQLTQLGKKMGKLPFLARHSKLILQSIDWGFAYEAVILVAFFSIDSNVFKYTKDEEYQKQIDASKIGLIQNESDALSFLYIFKSWIENKCSDDWCDKHQVEFNTLNEVKIKVDDICQIINECLNENILQEFCNEENSASNIVEMLFQCFADNLCVFSGHYRCGYRIVSSRQTAFLHPSSILCNKENLPQLIIFNKIVNTSRNFLLGITAIPTDIVLNKFTEKPDLEFSDIFERNLVSEVIEPVGERIINQVLLGKKGKKLQEIEEKIKKELKSDMIVIEPSVEKGCVYVYALQPVLDAAVKKVDQILKSNIEDIINATQLRVLELKRGETTVPVEIKCIKGAKVTSVKIKDISQQPDTKQNSNSVTKPAKEFSSVQYSINLTWVRRACNGLCYVSFQPSSFMHARKLAMRNISILGSEVEVEVSKRNETELILTDVPGEARINDVEETFRKYLPHVEINKIEFKFIAPFETTVEDIDKIKMEIQENCEEYTELLDFEIIIPKPKNTATIMTAYINVFGSEDLTADAESLSNILIRNFKVTAIPVYRSVTKFNFKIYKALESRIQEGMDKLKFDLNKIYPDKNSFRFEVDHLHDSNLVLIKLLSNDIKIMKHLQKTINELLEGEVLSKTLVSDIHKLFCHGGHMWLRTLEKSKKVYILEEYNSKTIRVYGSRESCFKVKESIINFLEDTESEAVETISLSNENNNRVLLKSLITEYGVNLEKFVELCQLRSAVLDIKSCRLLLHGSRDSIDEAKNILNRFSTTLDSTEEYSLLSGGEMCPVCACPAFNLTIRLQNCGHLYCSECILGLVEQAQFPIQCCAINCSEDLVLDDIVRVLEDDDEKIKKLLHSSLNNFLENNRSEFFYCPAPDCKMFSCKNEITEKWKCPLCQNEICTNCNVVYHYGFTCDVYQGSKIDPDFSFKVWKQGTTQCKNCPSCQTAIEKNEGCDHMTCLSCKAHFCWVCCREFPCKEAVYNHIPFCDQYPKW